MNTLLLALIAAALVVLVALLLRPVAGEREDEAEAAEDARVAPLVRGINYLLNDEPDRALQEMVRAARLRSDAAEVYLALGDMFLGQGEIGRAVRIHQNLLARPDLPEDLRLQAQFALARDFQTGGLLDRALRHYEKVLAVRPDHVPSLEACLRIREASHEWDEAESVLARIEQVTGRPRQRHRAYLLAEQAARLLEKGNPGTEEAEKLVDRALSIFPGCGHAWLIRLRLAMNREDRAGVIEALEGFWQHAGEYLPLALNPLVESGLDERNEVRGRLREWGRGGSRNSQELALSWIEAVARIRGRDAARALKEEIGFEPAGLRSSLRLTAAVADGDGAIESHARAWRSGTRNFACERCGVEVVEMRWQCPQCHAWGTMHPIGEEEI